MKAQRGSWGKVLFFLWLRPWMVTGCSGPCAGHCTSRREGGDLVGTTASLDWCGKSRPPPGFHPRIELRKSKFHFVLKSLQTMKKSVSLLEICFSFYLHLMWSKTSPCGICGGQSVTGTVFSASTSDLPSLHRPTSAPYTNFIHLPLKLSDL
jgi:hypothetical protein